MNATLDPATGSDREPGVVHNDAHLTGENYVSLFDRLVVLAGQLPASHVIAESRVGRLLSALVHYAEHGAGLLDAADAAVDTARRELQLPTGQRTAATDVPTILNTGYPDAGGDPAASRDLELEQLRAQLQAFNDRLTNAEAVKPDPAAEGDYQPPTVPPVETSVDVRPAADAAAAPPAGEPPATPAGEQPPPDPAAAPLPAPDQGEPGGPAGQPLPGADRP